MDENSARQQSRNGKLQKKKRSDFVSGHSPITSTPTALEALKRTLQELLGSDRWYGTMPKECMIVWTIVLKDDREETTTTEELLLYLGCGFL
jgi:hypothetical protein